jgi:hypothetical protein
MKKKFCTECGAVFTPERYNQSCCSAACQRDRKNRIHRLYEARQRDPFADARKERRRARRAFLASRDEAYAIAGFADSVTCEVRGRVFVETRGRCAGGPANWKVGVVE